MSFVAFHYRSYGTFCIYSKRLHNFHGGFTHYRNYRAKKIHWTFVFAFQIWGSKIKRSTGPLFSLFKLGLKDKKVHWTFVFAFQIWGSKIKRSTGPFYSSSIKLLKTSSIISHSAVASSGIGCKSPSVPFSFSMYE